MITQLEVFTSRVALSPLPTTSSRLQTDPVQVRKIDGLGPVNANLNMGKYGSIDGEFYRGSSIGKRNIVLTVGLNPDWVDQSYEQLRQILYLYFMTKKDVKLRFTSTHMPTVEIDGYVETMEENIFSNDPEMQISIICPKPDFVASYESLITGVTVALPDGDPTVFEYQGTVPTGFNLKVSKGSAADMTDGEVRMINENPNLELFIVNEATVNATQYLEISTASANKFVRLVPDDPDPVDDILGVVSGGSKWLALDSGLNNFRVASDVVGQDWVLGYYARYGGL